eukprot:SAG31_NODE_162_length_21892_cov_343.171936_16_plen_196_part_00
MAAARPARGRGNAGSKKSVQVYIRVRPDLPAIDGVECGQMPHLLLDEEANTIQLPDVEGPAKAYKCHRVFGPEQNTGMVYNEVFREPMDQMAQGFNVTLFAYGQTGSGKTYTMSGTQGKPGITAMAFGHIFDNVKASPNMDFKISVSVMEIYQDVIYDLLDNRSKVDIKGSGRTLRFTNLQVRNFVARTNATRSG